jgi:hypothetical protein
VPKKNIQIRIRNTAHRYLICTYHTVPLPYRAELQTKKYFSSSIEEEGVNLADEERLGGCLPSYEDPEEDEQDDEQDDVEDEDDVYDARKSSRTALSPIQEGPGLEA